MNALPFDAVNKDREDIAKKITTMAKIAVESQQDEERSEQILSDILAGITDLVDAQEIANKTAKADQRKEAQAQRSDNYKDVSGAATDPDEVGRTGDRVKEMLDRMMTGLALVAAGSVSGAVSGLIGLIGAGVASLAKGVLTVFFASMMSILPKMLPFVTRALMGIVTKVGPVAIAIGLVTMISGAITQFIDSERTNLSTRISEAMFSGLGQLLEFLSFGLITKEQVNDIVKPFLDWSDGIINALESLTFDDALNFIKETVDTINEYVTKGKEFFFKMGEALYHLMGLDDLLVAVDNALNITQFSGMIEDAWQGIVDLFSDAINSAIENIKSVFRFHERVREHLSNWLNKIKESTLSLFGMGENQTESMSDPSTSMIGSLGDLFSAIEIPSVEDIVKRVQSKVGASINAAFQTLAQVMSNSTLMSPLAATTSEAGAQIAQFMGLEQYERFNPETSKMEMIAPQKEESLNTSIATVIPKMEAQPLKPTIREMVPTQKSERGDANIIDNSSQQVTNNINNTLNSWVDPRPTKPLLFE